MLQKVVRILLNEIRLRRNVERTFFNRYIITSSINHRKIQNVNSYFHVNDDCFRKYFEEVEDKLIKNPAGFTNNIKNSTLLNLFNSRKEILKNLISLTIADDNQEQLFATPESCKQWDDLIEQEKINYENELKMVNNELVELLAPTDGIVENILLEVKAGIGGQEAMIFAKTLFDMYLNYIKFKNWRCIIAEKDTSDIGGLRHGAIMIEDIDAMSHLRHECGVHRVQRIPLTEKSGRLHTSTVTVAVLPQPSQYEHNINEKDLIIETFRSSGAGGQHVNKTDSAVRIIHIPTKTVVESQTDRSQIKNRQIALQKLRMRLYEEHINAQEKELRDSRKAQVGSSARSDKVRTYNFSQDRISDHRLNENVYDIKTFLEGSKHLDKTIQKLIKLSNKQRIELFLNGIQQRFYK